MKKLIFLRPFSGNSQWGNFSKRKLARHIKLTTRRICYLALIIIINFSASNLFAQNFFPLKVGNAYQIENDWYVYIMSHGISGTDYYNLMVPRDTLINGELFYSLPNNLYQYYPFNSDYLFRYDSLNQKLLVRIPNDSTTRLAVDFTIPFDSQYTSFIKGEPKTFISQGIFQKVILGDTNLVYSMKHPMDGGELEYTYEFAANVGISKYKSYLISNGYESSYTHNLIAAIIDTVKFAPLISVIDSLYPVVDRPVDTFPFLLSIPYYASYVDLVDSFYLDVKQLRSDTLIQVKKYNVSLSNPGISLYLSGLLPGDKIKLRATITDTSIFNNSDHYPDTGWVTMNVLPPILNVDSDYAHLAYELAQNYPNPFNPITRIKYQIPEPAFVTIKVYDVLGNEIETLMREEKIAGSHELEFDGSELTSGIYYYRFTSESFSQTKKMILLK